MSPSDRIAVGSSLLSSLKDTLVLSKPDGSPFPDAVVAPTVHLHPVTAIGAVIKRFWLVRHGESRWNEATHENKIWMMAGGCPYIPRVLDPCVGTCTHVQPYTHRPASLRPKS